MSNALAIAAVTAVMKDLLDNAMIDGLVHNTVGDHVDVSALPIDRIVIGSNEKPGLNLFLYQIAANSGWRNHDLPSHDSGGHRLANPPLALDLSYFLTAFGKEDFQAEILLGYAMQVFHENPVLTRDRIRRSLSPTSPVTDSLLPGALKGLSASDLAEQIELIRITQRPMGSEEISKLWSAIQVHYRTTVAYNVSVVLIESSRPRKSPLPVLTRGEGDIGPVATAGLIPPFPMLSEVSIPGRQPAARLGDTVTLLGHHLDGESVTISFSHPELTDPILMTAIPGGTLTELRVRIPRPPLNLGDPDTPADRAAAKDWPAGLYIISAIVQEGTSPPRTTNAVPLSLAPRMTTVSATRSQGGIVTLTVVPEPDVRLIQKVTLVLGEREVGPQPRQANRDPLTFSLVDVHAGEYFVRLRVGGVESLLIDRTAVPPVFFASPEEIVRVIVP